ncbi:bis(5'-nucleosyl)-tetraphosphatase (symmetrical) YqeK [Bacillota bacterium LX-D]|nr:bis(5'-nucleosyl)-tetraphosphatase (symmetrical) YqeK [Bacillota bacterium LX-D]
MENIKQLIQAENKLIAILHKRLSSKRMNHTLNVAQTAAELAAVNQINCKKAVKAGLLHDYARELSSDELLILAKEAKWPFHPMEQHIPILLHGPVAAYLVNRDLKISDQQILKAIQYHTTGCPGMDKLSQIVYIADMIEPGRNYEGVEKLRHLAYEDLRTAFLQCLEHSIFYIIKQGGLLHPLTVEARNDLILTK